MSKPIDLRLISKKIRKFYRTNRRMPTHKELCMLFGYATKASSQYLVRKLVEAGLVEKDSSGKLVPKKLFLPQLGYIQAGHPVMVDEAVAAVFSLDEYLVDQPETSFVLTVSGDSMINAGIHPGDVVVEDTAKRPKMGDIVVANVDNEFTLKYLKMKNGRTYLVAGNPKYKPIHPRQNLTINGVVVSVARKYVS